VPRLHAPDLTQLGPLDEPSLASAAPVVRPLRPPTGRLQNVLLVSHTDFTGNSALHVVAIAAELARLGLDPVVAVPQRPHEIGEISDVAVPTVAYRDVLDARFADGRGPDIVHAFSPRELVRRLIVDVVDRFDVPYVVHLEDNDEAILAAHLGVEAALLRRLPIPILDELVGPSHAQPARARRLLALAGGVTVITRRLLELVPEDVPTRVVHAGYDPRLLDAAPSRAAARAALTLPDDAFVLAYTGSVHAANLDEVSTLYDAVGALRADGRRVVLVKTGTDDPERMHLPALGEALRDLGRVPRTRVAEVLAAADALVQPGAPGVFNDFRFPSKLPDFLASGRPVVLPRTNIGADLENGVDALLLEDGTTGELVAALELLADDPALRARLGARGRAFALEHLSWSASAERVADLYTEVAARPHTPAAPLEYAELPVELAALVDAPPSEEDLRPAAAAGIAGFVRGAASPARDVQRAVLSGLVSRDERVQVVIAGDTGWDETRSAVTEALRRFYESCGLTLTERQATRLIS